MHLFFALITRLLLLAASLAVAACLLVLVSLFATVWALRYAWARLTGRPGVPFVMRVDPRAGFDRMRARARPDSPVRRSEGGAPADVTDVVAKPARGEG